MCGKMCAVRAHAARVVFGALFVPPKAPLVPGVVVSPHPELGMFLAYDHNPHPLICDALHGTAHIHGCMVLYAVLCSPKYKSCVYQVTIPTGPPLHSVHTQFFHHQKYCGPLSSLTLHWEKPV